LIGHSMGCRIVSEIYSQSPLRVRGVIYVDGSIVAAAEPDAAVQAAQDMLSRMTVRGFIDRLYDDFHVATTPQAVRDAVNAHRPAIDLDFAQRLWFDLVRWDATYARARLAALAVPALAIQSTYLDAAMQRASLPPGASSPWTDAVMQTAQDARLSVIPGVGHFPQLEAPVQMNDAIRQFVRQLPSRQT
jgi:pimeloyl-ACP methyl ester carboxylesterase